MKALTGLIRSFAVMLAPGPGNEEKLQQWIASARAADLPNLHSFTRGLDLDIKAATAALTLPHHNGRTEGVNTKTKMLTESATEPLKLQSPSSAELAIVGVGGGVMRTSPPSR